MKNDLLSAFDRLLGVFSPSLMYRRASNKAKAYALTESVRLFDGATSTRRGSDMPMQGQDNPNYDLGQPLKKLKLRSRYLYRNNAYARKAIKTIANNVVGTGIQPAPMGGNDAQNDAVKSAFMAWANSKKCDFHGRKNFFAMQKHVMQAVAIDGEVLVVKRRSGNRQSPLTLQVVSCDYLNDSADSFATQSGQNFITRGIEFDSDGRVVAYHIYKTNPEDINTIQLESDRVPASEVLHIFEQDLVGQVRGVPFLAASMLRISDLNGYEDAQLMRQKIAACFSVFITGQPDISGLGGGESTDLERVEPGIIERLAPGEQVSFGTPPPADGYKDYVTKVQEGIAASLGITYSQLTGDLSNVNFSSGRMGWMEAQRQIEDWQFNLLIPDFCHPVFEWFLEVQEIQGMNTQNITAEWTPQGRYMIDPAKEVKAKISELGAGLKSWSEMVREMGYNPDVLLEELKSDKEKLAELGLDWLKMPEQQIPQE